MSYKQIALKFKKFEDPDLLELAAERIRLVPGVVSIKPLFPETDSAELKTFYILEVVPAAVEKLLEQLLRELREDPNVELVHQPAPRTL